MITLASAVVSILLIVLMVYIFISGVMRLF